MARIEGIAEQDEGDRELKRTDLETDRESKLSSEIELEKLKHSVDMKFLELMLARSAEGKFQYLIREAKDREVSACARSEIIILWRK